jgi:preprotein translocase subunit YajC
MGNTWILAQEASGPAPARIGSEPVDAGGQATTTVPDNDLPGPPQTQQRTGAPWMNLLPLVLIFVVMYLLLLRGPRKQEQQRKQMVQSLKKNDHVRTIGGIYGVVMDVKGDEVVLKVDEANNTKMRVSMSAIGKNLSQDEKER